MRVLSIGSMYPPHHLGGYELTWRSAVRHLRDRGHDVRVLTTDYRNPEAEGSGEDTAVHRELRWYWRDHRFPRMSLGARLRLERHNAAILDRHLADHEPHAVNWWAMGGMSLSLIERVRRTGVPAVGVVGDEWMVYGPRVDAWLRMSRGLPLASAIERRTGIPCRIELGAAAPWLFNSELTRRRSLAAGWRLPDTDVVHPGIDHELFRPAPEKPWRGRLLCLGRIDRRKGLMVAMRALAGLPDARLTIVGTGDETHLAELRARAASDGLHARVSFTRLPRPEVPDAYAAADVLVFPVQWEEPWGLVPLEAMAMGTPVVATGTGGSAEYLRDGENCLIFRPRDDPEALAEAVSRLGHDERLRRRLRKEGLLTAGRFDERSYNRAIERRLEEVAR